MQKRNVGIEFLRLLSMFFIVILHLLGAGGILEASKPLSAQYIASWGLEMLALCSVNCYCLISGYVGNGDRLHLGRLLSLWLQVIFYTVLITVIFATVLDTPVSRRDWMNAILPVTTAQYWYVSAYFGLFFLIPILNMGIANLDNNQIKKCLVGTILLYTILPVVLNQDPFVVSKGYSVIWLLILYLLGAYLKKGEALQKYNRSKALIVAFICVLVSWGGRMLIEAFTLKTMGEIKYGYVLASYTSPLILLASVGFLIWFAGAFQEKEGRLLCVFSKATLGVYVIHTQPLLFEKYIKGNTASWANQTVLILCGKVILSAVCIFLACLMIDVIRAFLFKLLHIKNACDKITSKIE